MAEPLPRTMLSLDRWAQLMGIAPMPFNTATARDDNGNVIFHSGATCSDVWWQYDWQNNDQVSRWALAHAIKDAEDEIEQFVNYHLAPIWDVEEVHDWPHYHRRDAFGGNYDVQARPKSVHTNWGKVIGPGRRAVSDDEITDVAVAYSDADADGFLETATVTATTTLTDPRHVKVYFDGMGGDPRWEIRPARSKTISGGTFTATFWTWQLIDPDEREDFPKGPEGDVEVIDISGDPPGNVVDDVDVYYEYNDTTDTSAQIIWEPDYNIQTVVCGVCGGTGCAVCTLTTQNGCFHVKDAETGWVTPSPATYDADEEAWSSAAPTVCREPDMVKLWYYSGELSQPYLNSRVWAPLSEFWARVIAELATARLERPICECGNTRRLNEYLMEDLAYSKSGESRLIDFRILGNPFGTRRGEVRAWQKVSKLADNLMLGGAV